MTFSEQQISLLRQWYNALCDAHPEYLEAADHELGRLVGGQRGPILTIDNVPSCGMENDYRRAKE